MYVMAPPAEVGLVWFGVCGTKAGASHHCALPPLVFLFLVVALRCIEGEGASGTGHSEHRQAKAAAAAAAVA